MNTMLRSFLIFLMLASVSHADFTTDGADDYVQITTTTSNAELRPSPAMTACVWSKRNGANETYGHLFGAPYNDSDSAPYDGWSVQTNNTSDNQFIGQVTVNGFLPYTTIPATANVFPNTTDWHYVCLRTRYSTVIDVDLVVDGVQVATNTTTGTNIVYDTTSGAGEITFGCESDDGDNCVNHTFGEFTYWKTSLTDSEILSIYKARKKRFAQQIQPTKIIMNKEFDDFPDGQAVSGGTYSSSTGQSDVATSGTGSTGVTSAASAYLNYP